jgi:hypothetical protein
LWTSTITRGCARPGCSARGAPARARHDRLGAPEVDDDVAALEALDGAVDHLADAVDELVVDVLALGLADALVEHLLGRLGGDAAEALGRHRDVDLVADGGVGLVVRASSTVHSASGSSTSSTTCLTMKASKLAGVAVEWRAPAP